ncbi:MAG TPA: DUF3472 domain-containing protein [Pirellulales bacterium]|nr:DUF3472 domain-containing protein [Pirellulales bacterium]
MRLPRRKIAVFLSVACVVAASPVAAQHLWWDTVNAREATCLFGEITVLASHQGIYYCGANWHPGEPAGGYCGIQHNTPKERRTIFSIWDTSPKLQPKVTEADAKTIFNRFGGEGEGAHTHLVWNWQVGEPFRFFVEKQPGVAKGTTDTRYYMYDAETKTWRHLATIASPDGDDKSAQCVATITGRGLASFLENFTGQDRDTPKLALYRLWAGTQSNNLQCLTVANGDGKWGQLHDAYFLAEGSDQALENLFAMLKSKYGSPTFGDKRQLAPISDRALSTDLLDALRNLPRPKQVEGK